MGYFGNSNNSCGIVLKSGCPLLVTQKVGTAVVDRFSQNDEDFVKGGTGLYLATPNGNEYLPSSKKE